MRSPIYRHEVPIRFLTRAPAVQKASDCREPMMENRHYRVNRSDICFLKYLLESYEGLATVSTLNAAEGHIVVRIAPGCVETVTAVMASLAADMYFEPIAAAGSAPVVIDPQ